MKINLHMNPTITMLRMYGTKKPALSIPDVFSFLSSITARNTAKVFIVTINNTENFKVNIAESLNPPSSVNSNLKFSSPINFAALLIPFHSVNE
jgi:hypothetical protein